MTLHEQVTDILASAVEAQECAGISVLVRRCGEEMLYTQAGMSDIASGRLIHRDSIFRLYSQSKPITAAAVMPSSSISHGARVAGRIVPCLSTTRAFRKPGR